MTATVALHAIQPGPADKAKLVERAARICYRSEMSETAEERMAFLGKLAKRGHLSVFEHARYIRHDFSDTPCRKFWRVRYGTQITGGNRVYIVSMNARSQREHYGVNPIFDSMSEVSQIPYGDLTDAEKLAHASATFEVSGISRACSAQMNRHRVNSPSEESQRYCDGGDWEAVVPPTILKDHPTDNPPSWGAAFSQAMWMAKLKYTWLRKCGIPKQDARFVLPNATPTRLMVTATFEHWRHFLTLRLDKAAQWEIRGVAQEIHAALMGIEPGLFGDL